MSVSLIARGGKQCVALLMLEYLGPGYSMHKESLEK